MREQMNHSLNRRSNEIPSMSFSNHARQRMTSRGISSMAVQIVMRYGRMVQARGAEICVIGRKEVEEYGNAGIDLSRFEGIHVLCSREGAVITTYRNRNSLNLGASRPRRRRYGRRSRR